MEEGWKVDCGVAVKRSPRYGAEIRVPAVCKRIELLLRGVIINLSVTLADFKVQLGRSNRERAVRYFKEDG